MWVTDNDAVEDDDLILGDTRPNVPIDPLYATDNMPDSFAEPEESAELEQEETLPRPKVQRRSLVREILDTLLLVVAIYTIVHLVMPRYIVEGSSMQPNFETGQWIMVSRLDYLLGEPQRGDVVILNFDEPDKKDLIKRIVGLPGETVEIHDGQVFINGEAIYEPYITHHLRASFSREWVLGPDEYIVLGDNRTNSRDSRAFGPVTREIVVGQAWVIYWPPPSWSIIPNYDYTEEAPPLEPTPSPVPSPAMTPDFLAPPPLP